MKKNEIDLFEKTYAQMQALHSEISTLSKKSPNDGVNTFKLNFTNNVIEEANKILGKKYKPFSDFDRFDEENIPTNSDVTMILSQYINCLEKLRSDNIHSKVSNWYWNIDDDESNIRTSPPKKIKG